MVAWKVVSANVVKAEAGSVEVVLEDESSFDALEVRGADVSGCVDELTVVSAMVDCEESDELNSVDCEVTAADVTSPVDVVEGATVDGGSVGTSDVVGDMDVCCSVNVVLISTGTVEIVSVDVDV